MIAITNNMDSVKELYIVNGLLKSFPLNCAPKILAIWLYLVN